MRAVVPVMPSGSDFFVMYGRPTASWMIHLKSAAYLELITSVAAVYWMKKTERAHFLKPYLLFKCCLIVSVAAAFFGLTTIKTSMLFPTTVLLWEVFLIASLFIHRLDQYMKG